MSIRGLLLLAGWVSLVGASPLDGSKPAPTPRAYMLEKLRPGQWDLRQRGESMPQRVCIKAGMELIQLRHPGRICERIVLEQADSSILVQYTCRGSGFGRTRIRRETSQLVQIETQGVADGFPFDFSAEGRWVGECQRSTG